MTAIRRGMLSELFVGAAVKRLSAVETDPAISNQHEFNGAGELKRIFGGGDQKEIPARFIWLGDEQEGVSAEGIISWYDSRRRHPTRSEYRLYYSTNEVTEIMRAGDSFFVALRANGEALVIVTASESTSRNQLLWLFGLDDQQGFGFVATAIDERSFELDFAVRYILDEIGVSLEEGDVDELDALLAPFGTSFPTTRIFAELARNSLPDVRPDDDPDAVIMAWLEREEALFRRFERRLLSNRLRDGFFSHGEADVDGFLSFSLSVQNRRKSRAGQSLEHHLEQIFTTRRLGFARGVETENRNKPDFLFPGQLAYRDPAYPVDRLTMLGAKSTAKDRWRQVLAEADRITHKHLMTLEPGISEGQTAQMQANNLQLVVPAGLHKTYKPAQQEWLFSVSDFVRLVQQRETN